MSQCVYLLILPLAKCCGYRDVASAGFYCFTYLLCDCIWVILYYKREWRSAQEKQVRVVNLKFSFRVITNSSRLSCKQHCATHLVWFCCSWEVKSATVSSCPWVAIIPQRFPRWQWPCPALSSADTWMRAVRSLSDRSVFPLVLRQQVYQNKAGAAETSELRLLARTVMRWLCPLSLWWVTREKLLDWHFSRVELKDPFFCL